MPIDVPDAAETGDQGIARFIGETTRLEGEGHGSGYDHSVVQIVPAEIIDPATGVPYVNYPTGGLDITPIVSDTRHCRFKRILEVEVRQMGGTHTWLPEVDFPNGQFLIHRPVVGDVMLQFFVQTAAITEPMAELANEGAIPDITIRCNVTGVRGLNPIDISVPA